MDSRIYKINLKVNRFERSELNRIMILEGISLSDLIRKAIRNTFKVEGFELSYESASKFEHKRKSIFD